MTKITQRMTALGAAAWLIAILPAACEPPEIPPGAAGGSGGTAGSGAAGGSGGTAGSGAAGGSGGIAGSGASAGDGSAEAGEGGTGSGEAGSPGETAGAGGATGDEGDPVLGCPAGEWPSQARLELLPPVAFDDFRQPERLVKVSADGEVVVGHYGINDSDTFEPDNRRPVVWDGTEWQWVDRDAFGFPTTLNCDGSVIAGRHSYLDAFIKTKGWDLVIVPGMEPSWAAIPSDTSADGSAIAGNFRDIEPQSDRGFTDPVVWTNGGLATFLWPLERRTARHIRHDGLLLAGDKNVCTSGMFCSGPADLYVSTGRFDETVYPEMPWSIMSSDLSTSTGKRMPPIYRDDDTVIALFRIPDQFMELPCPEASEWCEAVALSSHGNILLVNGGGSVHLWTATGGYQNLSTLLAADGIVLDDAFFSAADMSDDGRVIIGSVNFANESGERESHSFRAVLPRHVYADR